MSVLIKWAKPPSGCRWCYFNEDCKCALIVGCDLDDTNGTQRRKNCPLIELPDAESEIDKWWERNETVNAERSEEECEDENWYTELDDPKFAERSEDGET